MRLLLFCAAAWLGALTKLSAATLYVDTASTNAVPPFASWATAAVTIQDAVDAAAPGDEIVVTNGVYQTGARAVYGMSNRVAVTKPVTVRSVNGPESTAIKGMGMRVVYLTNEATLSGFTLTNGATFGSGGGVWCEAVSVVLSNCVITGNTAAVGGGTFRGTLNNCVITGNFAWDDRGGGGAYASVLNNCVVNGNLGYYRGGGAVESTLNNCMVTGNEARYENGGGALLCNLTNCTITGNSATFGGGAWGGTLEKCIVSGNLIGGEGAVGAGVAYCLLNDCILMGNLGGYGGGGAFFSTLNNCTVTSNLAGAGGGVFGGTLNNCIVYFNSALIDPNWSEDEFISITLNYSCTFPAPASGLGNITNAPLFVDTNGWSNLRLQSNSPCINAGNNAYVTTSTDLDGRPRVVGGVVDMGAYEYQGLGIGEFIGWLQQFGLSTDGSADHADTDHDAHDNWQEWMAGTDPTNALSALRLAAPLITPTNVILTWTSVTNRTYTLEQSTNLGGAPAFSVLRSNLAGSAGSTSWTDTNAPVASPRFYRLRVTP